MLHVDAGTEGTYEFPGDDGPVTVDGDVLTMPFMVTGLMEAEEAEVEAEAEEAEEAAAEDEEPILPASGSRAWLWSLMVVLAGTAMMVLGVRFGLRFARQRAND